MKVIHISRCLDCPHLNQVALSKSISGNYKCRITIATIRPEDSLDTIDYNCPLQDAKPQELTEGTT